MLHLKKLPLNTVEDLRHWLHGAVRLELSTLPPYLTALYSIKPGKNLEIAANLRSVALEEMLHMCLASNMLNAVGGCPAINAPGFAPRYPTPLPMGIGCEPGQPFIVPLKKLTMRLIEDIFMVIEEPEDPDKCVHEDTPESSTPDYHTIGEFYEAIQTFIMKSGDAIFTGDPALQVTGWFPTAELFPVTDTASACRAIQVIIQQGEGTKTTPTCIGGEYAHYYRFAEIANQQRLVEDPTKPRGYAFSGAAIPFDPEGVYPMVDNPTLVELPEDSLVARYAKQFDETYTALLNAMQATVTGQPDQLNTAVGVMYTLRLEAQQLMATRIPGRSVHAGPRWKFVGPAASA